MDQPAELCETYQLKWNFYSSYMHSCISTSLYNDSYADVALVTMDGHQLMAHRYVLSYSSRYFAQVLKYQRKVTTALPLMIVMPPEIDYKSLKVLVRYMYSGEAKVPKDILKTVLRGGDILQIKGLFREKDESGKLIENPLQSPSPLNPTPISTPATTPTPSVPSPPPVIASSSVPPPVIASSSVPPPLISTSTPKIVKKPTVAIPVTSVTATAVNVVPSSTSLPPQKMKPTYLLVKKPKESQTYASVPNTKLLNFTFVETPQKEDTGKKVETGEDPGRGNEEKIVIKNENTLRDSNLQYLMIKDEPVDWVDGEMEVIDSKEVYEDIQLKSEHEDESGDSSAEDDKMFSPLTCELCTETFTIPKEWVRHVQTHTDMMPAKRRRRDSTGGSDSYENDTFPELMCDLCQKPFTTPAEWVKHIQSAHTEFELHLSNKQNVSEGGNRQFKPWKLPESKQKEPSKLCTSCNKTFPSNASMLIHKRRHTGEKPFSCESCSKTFNVKSNLLRHLRTIHNKIINATDIDNKDDEKSD